MSAIRTVFVKEVRENLRDRRTLASALILGPLLSPILFTLVLNLTLSHARETAAKPLSVPIVGAQNAPRLVEALRRLGLVVRPAPTDPEREVSEEREDVVLRIPAEYQKRWERGEPATVEVISDDSREDAKVATQRLQQLVQTVGQQTAALRLVARGLSPQLVSPIAITHRDLSTAQSRSALLFSMLPYLFTMTILVGGMYLAIDTTAGERERQSLEPLFVNPVSRGRILFGKLCATWLFATLSLCLGLLAFALAKPYLPIEELGMALDLGPRFAARVLVVMLPSIVLIGTMQTLVSAFAKSFREAQTYLSLLTLVPIIPSVVMAVSPLKPTLWMYAVPLLGQQLSIMRFVRGESVTMLQLSLCCGATALLAVALVAITARVYASERLAISA